MFNLCVAFCIVDLEFLDIPLHLLLWSAFVKVNCWFNPSDWVDFLEMEANLLDHFVIWLIYKFLTHLEISHLIKCSLGLKSECFKILPFFCYVLFLFFASFTFFLPDPLFLHCFLFFPQYLLFLFRRAIRLVLSSNVCLFFFPLSLLILEFFSVCF